MKGKIKILFLAASIDDEGRKRSEREAAAITKRLRASNERHAFELITRWAVRTSELQEHLLEHQPHVVHFSGQATEAGNVLLLDDSDNAYPVSEKAMAELFRILKDNIRVVVLNISHADALAQHLRWIIDFAISMKGAVDNQSAITFSAHFYQGLGFGRTVTEAFELAANQLMIDGKHDHRTPVLYVKVGANKSDRLIPERAGAAGLSETVRQLSRIAVKDSELVVNDRFGTFGGDVRLDQGLYVDRTIEKSLAQILAKKRATPTLILIVGEAGNGKTSLLWRLHQSLAPNDGWEPLFIKSTLFLAQTTAQSASRVRLKATFNQNSLLAAVEHILSSGRCPVILLDTVDLLLRDETGRNFLLNLVLTLQENGSVIVATCRPQEAVLFSVDPIRLTLRKYDDDELTEAINKHAMRFYALSVRKNYADEFAHVLNAVARGLPVREVCSNPLTLRMLFTIYAPAVIPEDINVFKLYQEYWSYRVEQDLRAPSPLPTPGSADLSSAASAVAVAMLAEGTSELDTQRLESALAELGHTKEGVSELVQRGVLHDSEAGTVSFFHQTFFEHSAARGLLRWRGLDGLTVLGERRRSQPNDLFVSPVYEQALLLAERAIARIAEAADAHLIDLLQSNELTLTLSGMYVYCHRQAVSRSIAEVMRTFLLKAEESSVVRFLELAANTPNSRLNMLFSELDVIWRRGNWREQDHLLKLLERLVPRNHAKVERLIVQHDVLEYVLGKPVGFTGEWKVLRMLAAIAEYDPVWSMRMLIELYLKAIPRAESRELQAAVLNTLCDRADLFGPRDIATRFEAATGHLNLDRARNVELLSIAYGRLLSVEWRALGRGITEIVEEIKQTDSSRLKLIARMRGLAFVLLQGDENDAATAFSFYKAEGNTPREWLWTRIVWPQVLAGVGASDQASPVVVYARREAARIMASASVVSDVERNADEDLARRIRTSVREAILPPEVLSEMLDIPQLAEPEPWLSVDQYAPLLADAFVAEHRGAVVAMNQLLDEPERIWPNLKRVVGPPLKRLSAAGGCALEALLAVSLKIEDEAYVLRSLEQSVPGAHQRWKHELYVFQQRLLSSPSATKRSTAVLIWSQLLRLGLAPAPELDDLRRVLTSESDSTTRGHLMILMGQAATGANVEISSAVDVLSALATVKEINIREKAFASLVKIVAEASADPAPFAMRVLDAALSRPTNAARLSLMRPLIKRLTETDPTLAAEVFEKLLMESRRAGLGLNGSRKLLGRFKSLARLLVRVAPLATTRRLLERVPSLDRVLGVLVVDSVCHEAVNEMNPELDKLLNENIHNDIKQLILKYKHTFDRPAGWPELYTLLHRDALNDPH